MGKFPHAAGLALFALAALMSHSAYAESDKITSCRSFANAAANEWAAGRIVPTEQITMPAPGKLIVISYGRKFIVTQPTTGDGNIYPMALGELARERTVVYEEEYERCRSGKGLTIKIEPAKAQ